MSVAQPQPTDLLNNPSHSKLHRVIAADLSAPNYSLVVESDRRVGFLDGSETFWTYFKAGTQSGNVTYNLPTAQGAASTFLKNDGSGGLTWALASPVIGNTVSGGAANRVLYQDNSQNLAVSANLTFDGTTLGTTGITITDLGSTILAIIGNNVVLDVSLSLKCGRAGSKTWVVQQGDSGDATMFKIRDVTDAFDGLTINSSNVVNLPGSLKVGSLAGILFGTAGTIGILAPSSAYTPTNVTTDRAYDADLVLITELADVVGTMIADLQAQGILG